MTDSLDRARLFVEENYPDAAAAFLGGSAASGEATASSDLDVLVVLSERWPETAFIETTMHEGQRVEAFVYGRTALDRWLTKARHDARPVLDRLIGEGVALTGGELEHRLALASRTALAAGPEPLTGERLDQRRYSLSAVIDDLRDATDPGIRRVVMMTAWREAAELSLLAAGCWIGAGKWLLRELRSHEDTFGLGAWADDGADDAAALAEACDAVLAAFGGYLQSGFVRGSKPRDL